MVTSLKIATDKVTFTLDKATVDRLQDASVRLSLPKSQIVREAILEFYERIERLSPLERTTMLRAFDELVPKISLRGAEEADRELAALRSARRTGGRKTRSRDGE